MGSGAGAISLPSGGGALKGIGESFAPDPHTGTGSFAVPIALPPGRNGLQPAVELAYSTGSGNGAFGLGWSLAIPGIARKTSAGVPRYDDAADTFALSGGEDLVPVRSVPGSTHYQPRTEGLFAAVAHRRAPDTDVWEVRGRDGMISTYGTPGAAGSDPAVVADPGRRTNVFAWQLTSTVDPFGNVIEYEYEHDTRLDGPRVFDQLYLSRIRYLDYPDAVTGARRFLVEVRFGYGDTERPDPFSEHRAGFEIRTRRRCRSITVSTDTDVRRPVREYELRYLDERVAAGELPPDGLPPNGVSLLSQVTVLGRDGDDIERLPPLEFGYTTFDVRSRDFRPLTGHLPARSLASRDLTLVDLFGDGLPDVLEMNGAIRYWRNLGDGRFAAPRAMTDAPGGLRLDSPGVEIVDADGDGRADLLVTTAGMAGYFPLSRSGGWDRRSFHPYRQAPSFALDDPEVHLVDLDGDGVTDAVRSGARFEYFFHDRHRGWVGAGRAERKPLADFPNVAFSDERVHWADMSGDGLEDVVYLHRGNVAYWSNLGRGRWSSRIQMTGAPDLPDGYDPKRVLLGDVDGDGVADLVYVDHRRVLVWINRGGNGWSERIEIPGTPGIAPGDDVRLVDLHGTGTPGVLWTRDARSATASAGYFLDLSGGGKPYLLAEVDNHLGAVTRIRYVPSTRYYRQDSVSRDTRWRTSLPFPVQVVAGVEVVDLISGGKLVTEYRYRHGCYDGGEREFRGFGLVEQVDTETFEVYHRPGDHDFEPVPAAHFAPPTRTRTWFHQGPVGDEFGDWRELDFADEYWPGDPQLLGHTTAVNAFLASYPQTPTSRRVKRDALRTLRGSVLRTESYTSDGSSREARPHAVAEFAYGLREESAPEADDTARARIFFPHAVAERSTDWERGDDPLTQFSFADDYDEFGQPRRQTEVAPPRRSAGRRPVTAAVVGVVQPDPTEVLAVSTRGEYAVPEDGFHLRDRLAQQWTYELAAPPTVPETDPADVRAVLRDQVKVAREVAATFTTGAPAAVREVGHEVNHYDGPAFEGLPAGQAGRYGALTRMSVLVMTDAELDAALGEQRPAYLDGPAAPPPGAPPGFGADLGFRREVRADGLRRYYVDADRTRYDFQEAGGTGRGLVVATREARGGDTLIEFDAYRLLPVRVTDPVGLRTEAAYDYRLLLANRLTDANGNVAEFAYSPLGTLARTWARGDPGRSEGDRSAPSVLATADYFAYEREGQPICLRTVRRIHHDTDTTVPAARRDDTLESREYSDGLGRIIQTRVQAEEVVFGAAGDDVGLGPSAGTPTAPATGAAGSDRVIVSAWSSFDNKGRPVRVYQPFFDTGWAFRPEAASGRPTVTHYDGRGRAVRVVHPDGAEQRTVPGIPADLAVPDEFAPTPWEMYFYDANDLAGLSFGPDGAPLAAAAPAGHHGTPTSTIADAGGRMVCRVVRNGPDPATDWQLTRAAYDVGSNLLRLVDPLGRPALRAVYDLAGGALRVESNDAGVRSPVGNADGDPVEYRDGAGRIALRGYDATGRLVRCWARDDADSAVTLREKISYGDEGDRVANRALNRLGQPARHYDEAGVVEFERYDLKGTPLALTRRTVQDVLVTADWVPDWSGADPDAALDPREYRTDLRLDAVDRVSELRYPADQAGHRAVATPHYNRAGALERVDVDGAVFVDRIAYDAKGQRILVAYGNGVLTRMNYEPSTARLRRMHTQRCTAPGTGAAPTYTPTGPVLQDLGYGFDPVGNVTGVLDRAPGCGVPGSLLGADALDRTFDYDPLYRLIGATGREGGAGPADPVGDAAPRSGDPSLTRPYEEAYEYDHSDNLTGLRHTLIRPDGTRQTVRREFTSAAGSNRLAIATIGGAAIPYRYDAAGQLAGETTSRSFGWDHAGRMTRFTVRAGAGPASVDARYLYGATGERVKKVVRKVGGDESTVYVSGLFEHRRSGGTEQCLLHVLDDERRLAVVRVGPALPGDGAADMPVQYHLGDHLDSSHLVVGGAGAADSGLVRHEEYTPYGQTSFGSYGRKRYRFTAKECDEESGLYHVGARYYAPWLARWTSCDPAGLGGGTNLYVFSAGNPVTLRDDDGAEARPPRGAQVHVFHQKGHDKDSRGRQIGGFSKVVRAPGGKAAAQVAGDSAEGAKPDRAHGSGNDATSTPGSQAGASGGGGPPGSTGTDHGSTEVGVGGSEGGSGGSPAGVSASGSPQGSPTGSATSNGGSPDGVSDPSAHKKASGEGGTGIVGKGTGSLSQLDLAVSIANAASDPLQAAVDGAGEQSKTSKSGGLPEGGSSTASGNDAVQALYVAVKALKAVVAVAVMAVGATANAGGQAISVGSGRAYSVLYRVQLKYMKTPVAFAKGKIRAQHYRRAQQVLNRAMKKDSVLRQAIMNAQAQGKWHWHHSAHTPGVMELIPKAQHTAALLRPLTHPFARRAGGFAVWGKFYW